MPKSPAQTFKPISSDAFKSWSRCQKQFYYKYVKRLNWPSDAQHFALGRDVHKLLDYQARGLDCSLLLESAAPNVQLIWQKLMAHPMVHLPVVASEWGFHLPVGPQWVVGRLDRIARDGDKILVIDWKTGTGVPRDPENDWQTVLYMAAVMAMKDTPTGAELGLNNISPEQISFVYVEVKADESSPVREVAIPYSHEKMQQHQERMHQVVAAMATEDEYALPQTCPDKFCLYRSICGIEEKGH